jgi:receptor expression-enhancing protein 5/6
MFENYLNQMNEILYKEGPVQDFCKLVFLTRDTLSNSVIESLINFCFCQFLIKAESKTNVDRKYFAMGLGIFVAWLLFGLLAPLTISLIAFTYPAIQSVKSLEKNKNQEKWLTYWVVYGCFNIVEFFGDILLSWFPFYFFIKTAFLIWCMAPIRLNGSIIIFKMFVLPFFVMHKEKLDDILNHEIEDEFENKVDNEMKEKINELNGLVQGGLLKYLAEEQINANHNQ